MQSWEELESACMQCEKCELHKTRNNVVFGVGNRGAELMLIGEGPGEQEDKTGQPFVGRAGKLLDDMLKMIGLSRSHNVFIANIVKCRPPNNRDPQAEEREACFDWLHAQISLIKPKIIICLGRIAAAEFFGKDFKITRDHGTWLDKDGIKYMALYHPAALLRDPNRRPDTFTDWREIRRVLKEICDASTLLTDIDDE
jgi:DNA polymerase